LEFADGYKISIDKSKKAVSGAAVICETGTLMGLSMGPVVRAGFDIGILPVGIIVDTGKVSFGLDTTASMSVGWRPNPLEGELKREFGDGVTPAGLHAPMAFDLAYTAGGLFSAYLNRDNGKAFGLGAGGGYTTSTGVLIDRKDNTVQEKLNDLPAGVWYVRGAVIPNRRTRFTIYFDYYLRGLTDEVPSFSDFDDNGHYYNFLIRHPRNWYGWGLGISGKLF
jgi:hypothetical protein